MRITCICRCFYFTVHVRGKGKPGRCVVETARAPNVPRLPSRFCFCHVPTFCVLLFATSLDTSYTYTHKYIISLHTLHGHTRSAQFVSCVRETLRDIIFDVHGRSICTREAAPASSQHRAQPPVWEDGWPTRSWYKYRSMLFSLQSISANCCQSCFLYMPFVCVHIYAIVHLCQAIARCCY